MINKILSIIRLFSASPLDSTTLLTRLDNTLKEFIMNQAELKAKLDEVQANQEATQATLTKVAAEVQALIVALANTPNELDPAVTEAIDKLIATSTELNATAKNLDDLNPDLDGSSPS